MKNIQMKNKVSNKKHKYESKNRSKWSYIQKLSHKDQQNQNQELTLPANIDNDLQNTINSQLYQTDRQCPGCSPFFVVKQQYNLENKMTIFPIQSQELHKIVNQNKLGKYLCMLANEGSGLVLQSNLNRNKITVIGSIYPQQEKQKIKSQIIKAQDLIIPPIQVQFKFKGISNKYQISKYSNFKQQCLCITVRSKALYSRPKMHIFNFQKSKEQFHLYKHNLQNIQDTQIIGQQLYKYAQNFHKRKQRIHHCRIQPMINKSFQIINTRLSQMEAVFKENFNCSNFQGCTIPSQKPKLTALVLSHHKLNLRVEFFIKKMKNNGLSIEDSEAFEFLKPCEQVFIATRQILWLFSHNQRTSLIHQKLRTSLPNQDSYRLIDIKKYLRIAKKQIDPYFDQFRQIYYKKFGLNHLFFFVEQNASLSMGTKKNTYYYMSFKSQSDKIIALNFLECLSINCNFVDSLPSQKQDYKPKQLGDCNEIKIVK